MPFKVRSIQMLYYTRAQVDTVLRCILLVTWTLDFQVRTNLLRKACNYDEWRIDEVNLPPPLKK